MADRRRLGVVVLLDPPVATEVDGLRRALGDGALERIPPHITLVPPVNVAGAALPAALERLAAAAGATDGPIELTLGPPATFLPANPVLHLEVGGDLDALGEVRRAAFAPPLERTLSWPWVPHVTLADETTPERIAAALAALDHYRVSLRTGRVTMLEAVRREEGRRWVPIADVALGPSTVVGRGSLDLTLRRSSLLDPLAAPLAGAPPDAFAADPARLVVTARRGSEVVGVAGAWRDDAGGHVAVTVAPAARRQGVGGHLLAAVELAARRDGWTSPVLAAHGPAGFYAARSAWARAQAKGTDE